MSLQLDEILELVNRFNAAEKERRRNYYAYRLTQGPQSDTFDEHLERYGTLARTGQVASEEEIGLLESALGATLPRELRDFYTQVGRLRIGIIGPVEVFSVGELLERLAIPSRWFRFRSLGLVHMMSAAWTNNRPELEPENGLLDGETIARLNSAYRCIGWLASGGTGAFEYIYFDRAGAFGTLRYHQDLWGELYSEKLLPMMERSPADRTLSSILLEILRAAERTMQEFDEEDAALGLI